MMDKSTPRPWPPLWVDKRPNSGTFITAGKALAIARISPIVKPGGAEYIVRAVNAHDALVEACNMAARYITDENIKSDFSDEGYAYYDDVCDALLAALALVGGDA